MDPQAYMEKENLARAQLEERLGVPLPGQQVEVLPGVEFEFDLVSPDEQILGEVKASGMPEKGKLRETQVAEMCEAILFLLASPDSGRRLLVLTEQEFYDAFLETRQAEIALSQGIEILHVSV